MQNEAKLMQMKLRNVDLSLDNALNDINSFYGKTEMLCVGFVDIINSTNIVSKLSFLNAGAYYNIFLSSMSIIIQKFGGIVVKNIGDSLLFYFPKTKDSENKLEFLNAIECGRAMIKSREKINDKMFEYRLPEYNFRASLDYGPVIMSDSKTSFNKDLFGSAVNYCYKINRLANPNTLIIGSDLYEQISELGVYHFKEEKSLDTENKFAYPRYIIKNLL